MSWFKAFLFYKKKNLQFNLSSSFKSIHCSPFILVHCLLSSWIFIYSSVIFQNNTSFQKGLISVILLEFFTCLIMSACAFNWGTRCWVKYFWSTRYFTLELYRHYCTLLYSHAWVPVGDWFQDLQGNQNPQMLNSLI